MRRAPGPAGATLVELLVALLLLGLLASLGALALPAVTPAPAPDAAALRRAARLAVQERRAILVAADSQWVRFLPDGRVLRAPRPPGTGSREAD